VVYLPIREDASSLPGFDRFSKLGDVRTKSGSAILARVTLLGSNGSSGETKQVTKPRARYYPDAFERAIAIPLSEGPAKDAVAANREVIKRGYPQCSSGG
jgi:hypothetical protein